MSKIRVFELAEELQMPAEKLVEALRDLNLNISNPMSMIDTQVAGIIREVITKQRKKRPQATKKAVTPAPSATAPSEPARLVAVDPVKTDAKPAIAAKPPTPAPRNTQRPVVAQKQAATPTSQKPATDSRSPSKGPIDRTKDKRFQEPASAIVDRKLGPAARRNRAIPEAAQTQSGALTLKIEGPMTVGVFSKLAGRTVSEILKRLLEVGMMANINQQLDLDTLQIVAELLNLKLEIAAPAQSAEELEEVDAPESLQLRYPVVTVMGHVDHGKTSLLDAIRRTNVTAREAGGITQHIGAYQVDVGDSKVVFLDTPGHEAFTQMRARGAKVTDVAILVVAADDGVMPQTVEALNHAKAAQVPIIVAVNKIDKPGANVEKIKQQLTEYGIVSEEWGGENIFVLVSALQRLGIENLLAAVLTVAEVLELRANPNRSARGVVIEAHVDKGKGPVATVLVQRGTLNIGDSVVAGASYGKVRAMVSDKGKRIKKAGPSTPLEVHGLSMAPQASDEFKVVKDERTARSKAIANAEAKKMAEQRPVQRANLDDFFKRVQAGQNKELKLIIKGDVQGSVEALRPAVEKLSNKEVEIKVIHTGVGPVNESDVILAKASDAIVIGFNVRPDTNARRVAEQEQVDMRFYRIIYEIIDDLTAALKGMLAPVFREVVVGQAQVRAVFKVSDVGTIAGCMVTEGKITRQSSVRLLRGGVIIFEGKVSSLKRFKDDAREVAAGYECGIGIENYADLKEEDVIEAFAKEQVEAK
ncbi:MAG: Translation initiation factor IF-2 [Firmicutes bacterium]|nr:Translation initiation factor IF-2 [candidate division NPL-UPA2 bacterium]